MKERGEGMPYRLASFCRWLNQECLVGEPRKIDARLWMELVGGSRVIIPKMEKSFTWRLASPGRDSARKYTATFGVLGGNFCSRCNVSFTCRERVSNSFFFKTRELRPLKRTGFAYKFSIRREAAGLEQ